MDSFLSVEEARRRILSAMSPVGTERAFLSEARGHFLAKPVRAPEPSPRFDNSSRDGYAARWEDLRDAPVNLTIVDRSMAGSGADATLETGEAARVATGARIPDGADTVVMQEYCEVDGETLHVGSTPDPGRGAWIREAGSHVEPGETLLEAGAPLDSAAIGLLASFRRTRVDVRRRPRVAIVSTGDELVDVDQPPGAGEIVDSNAHMLEALVDDEDADAMVLPSTGDSPEAVRTRFVRALRNADLVLSSGGVSVGDRDAVRDVVDDLADGLDFWKVRMKPGKPLAFGVVDRGGGVPVIGLPGNPNSCFVGFHQFGVPALRILRGASPDDYRRPHQFDAELGRRVDSTARRRHYLAGRLRTREPGKPPVFEPARRQSSGNVRLFAGQNAMGIVPEGRDEMPAGATITAEPLSFLWP